VYYKASGSECNYDNAFSIFGLVADGKWHNATGGITAKGEAYGYTSFCNGSQPTVAGSTATQVEISTTQSEDRTCKVDVNTSSMIKCMPGAGAPQGKSLAEEIKELGKQLWKAGDASHVPFNGYLSLNLNATTDTNVTVSHSPYTWEADITPANSINTFYRFQATEGAKFQADLTFKYTDEMLKEFGYTADSLRWAVFNRTAGAWEIKEQSRVDVSTKTVVHTTSSFSEWTVIATSGALSVVPSALIMIGMTVFSTFAMGMI
jgi:hypothetical protein